MSIGSDETLSLDAERRVRREQIAYLYRFPHRIFGNVINGVLIVVGMWEQVAPSILLSWFGVVCLVTLTRFLQALAFQRLAPGPGEIDRWALSFMLGSWAMAALLGVASGVVWFSPSISLHVFVAFVIAGTTAIAMLTSYSHLPSAYGFLGFAVAPLGINLLVASEGNYISIAMGAMALLSIVLLVGQARVANAVLLESLRLKERNSALIGDLEAARDTLEARVQDRTEALASVNRSLVTEIEARKEAEARLVQAQKMEAVGQLTGGIAHDFNNLLGVVLGNLDLVMVAVKKDPKLAPMLGRAIEAAERGARLTHRLLAFSRRQTLLPDVVDINTLLAGLTDLMQRTLGASIKITMRPTPRLWPSSVDPNQLENALLNLAINARDAMPTGGELTISTENATLDAVSTAAGGDVPAGDYVLIEVRDTGLGMSRDVLEHALEPFFTTKDIGKGTGLGLSMVYGFVKQSGGYLQIESEVGRGTAVKLLLPLAEATARDPTRK